MRASIPFWLLMIVQFFPLAASAQAPNLKQFELVYRFTLNGQTLGKVTDTFKREGAHYQLTSVAKPDGKLAMLLPTLTLSSQGELRMRQFVPKRFSQTRSNAPEKTAVADFDWLQNKLTHAYKGNSQSMPLPAHTLDALSQLYSFTQLDKLPDQLELPITNGRKLMHYRYQKQPAERIEAALGTFETIEYRRIANADENAISVWIAPALNHLPLRIRVREDTGVFEQQLVEINFN